MRIRRVLAALLTLGSLSCGGSKDNTTPTRDLLPAWAFGEFKETGDAPRLNFPNRFREKRWIDVSETQVMFTAVRSTRFETFRLQCLTRVTDSVTTKMSLSLECESGDPIQLTLAYDKDARSWLVSLIDISTNPRNTSGGYMSVMNFRFDNDTTAFPYYRTGQ